jgi:secreted trypsin-like serine protease
VLTAAHCVKGSRPAEIHVLTGTQSLTSGGVRRRVASLTVHPNYRSRTSDYDVAVIMLTAAVNGINPVLLLNRSAEADLAATGTMSYVTGWGDIAKGGATQYPVKLYEVRVPIVARSICNAGISYDGALTGRMICAGLQQGGKDSCQGDSGGPMTVQDRGHRWRIQAGIVSWGEGCALKNFYGVYSRLAVLSSWVRAIMRGDSAAARAEACDDRDALQAGCLDRAIATVTDEAKDYLDEIRRHGTAAQTAAAETGQRAWSRSLAALCALDAASGGEAGRKACRLRETRNRAGALAAQLTEIGD